MNEFELLALGRQAAKEAEEKKLVQMLKSARRAERNQILEIIENHKLLPTYSKAASEFSEELWENIKYRLRKEITGGKDD